MIRIASSGKTANLSLNQWVQSDSPEREDFNSDNMKVDAAFKGLQDRTIARVDYEDSVLTFYYGDGTVAASYMIISGSGEAPYPGENGNWFIYSEEEGKFVDSGYPSAYEGQPGPQGEKGDKGDPGPQGEPGQDGRDGEDGKDGEDGTSFVVKGLYPTYEDLVADYPVGTAGDAYAVGDADYNDIYVWDVNVQAWENLGPIQGPAGQKGEPGRDGEDGKDGEPGPQGEQGPQGQVGPQGPQGTPTTVNGKTGTSITLTASFPTACRRSALIPTLITSARSLTVTAPKCVVASLAPAAGRKWKTRWTTTWRCVVAVVAMADMSTAPRWTKR